MLNLLGGQEIQSYQVKGCEYTLFTSTAYSFDKHIEEVLQILDTKPHGVWFFSFGFLDCHEYIMHKSIKYSTQIDEVINITISHYGRALDVCKTAHDIYVLDVPPVGFYTKTSDRYYPTRELQQLITTKFNHQLKNYCREHGVSFIFLWDSVGGTKKDLLKKECFINNGCYLLPEVATPKLEAFLNGSILSK